MFPDQKRKKIEQIRFENLSYDYEDGHTVFDEVTVEFPMNEIVWVKGGHLGAGRSTLLQVLAGLLTPSRGKYFVNDEDVSDMSFEEFLPFRLSMGYSFDLGGLLHNRTLFENLMLPLQYHKVMSTTEAEEQVNFYLKEFKIEKYKNHRPSAVQGGVRKMICLIRPLLLKPDLLLIDDPTLGLTQETMLKYFDFVQDLRRSGMARHVFVSTADEKLMSLLEHREILIDNGTILTELQNHGKKVVHL